MAWQTWGTRKAGDVASILVLWLVLVVGWHPASAQESEDVSRGQPVTLNLKDADINSLINTVAEVTGRNFLVDPRVRGQVTLVSSSPMEPDELYRAFLSVLQVHGFATLPAGEVIKIIPDANARQLGPDAGEDAAQDDVITTVIRVSNVPVAQLVPILRPLLPQQGHLAAYPPTNVLIVSDRAGNVERITRLVQEVDQAGNDEIDIVRLEHASVGEMVSILNSLVRTDAETVPAQQVQIAADERTNSVLLSGDRAQRMRMRALIAQLDASVEREGDTHVVYLRYSRAEDLVPVLEGVTDSIRSTEEENGEGTNSDGTVSIQAEETTNSLVITAPPAVMQSLRSVIDRLDIRRAQILVEAAIAEISENRGGERGVQWFADGSDDSGFASLTNFAGVGTSIGSLLTLDSAQPQVDDGLSLVVGDLDRRVRFGAFIRALAADRDTNILSTPSLVTLDNQEAEIRVAENRPFVTGQFTSEGRNVTNPFQTIEREDVGIILKIKPQINEGDAIQLEIEQEASNVIGDTASAGPITNRRTIKTAVLVEDGQIIALGGLMDDEVQEQEQRVPGLGSLPILGELFRYRSSSINKRNLMLFMQPTIVRDRAIADDFTNRKYGFMRAQQLDRQQRGLSMLPDSRPGSLPSLERAELPSPFDP